MKKILMLLAILPVVMACNGQPKAVEKKQSAPKVEQEVAQELDTIKMDPKTDGIAIDKIKLGQSLEQILKPYSLTKNDNSNDSYNLNLDYEEFAFNTNNKFKYNSVEVGKISSLVIYYLKKNKEAFCYELEMENSPNSAKVFAELNKSLGKSTFYKKSENTKQRPIFIDADGETETDHIIQELTKWKDQKTNATYFVIFKDNLTTKENKLSIITIGNSSTKFDEWLSYRSLKMVFD